MSSLMCDCEDFPCCDCGQEWLADQRDITVNGFDAYEYDDGPWPMSIERRSWLYDNPFDEYEPEVDDE